MMTSRLTAKTKPTAKATASPAKHRGWTLQKTFPYILLVCSMVGLIASFTLTYDKIKVLKDPTYVPSCNVNPIISCGSVMSTKQAEFMGIPNTVFGLVAFGMLVAIAVAMLAGARMKAWFWRLVNLGALVGLLGVIYLFFQGTYRINAICPYCFVTWFTVVGIFLYTTLWNLREGNLPTPKKLAGVIGFAQRHHVDIFISIFLLVIVLLLNHFWYYFGPK